MSVDIYSDVFIDNLPDSISWDNQVQSIGYASDQNAIRLQNLLPQLLVLCNIPNLPESTLDLLAFQFSVLFYTATNSITDPVARLAAKQKLIANNFYYHAHLGTPYTVQDIVATVFQPALIQEWFVYGGLANHFRILLQHVIDPSLESQILSLVTVVKRASQAMDGFFLYTSVPTEFYVAVGVFTQIWLFLPMPVSSPFINYLTIGFQVFANATVHSASMIAKNVMGMHLSGSVRQILQGAPVADIKTGISVRAAIGALRKIMAIISMAEKIGP
jgi:P2-related tail formation protein